MYHYHPLIIASFSLDFRTTLQNLVLRVSLWSEKKREREKEKATWKGLYHLSLSPSLCLEHKGSNKSTCWNLPMWVMDAVSLHVLTRVSSQMAPVRLSASWVPSLYGQFHFQACFWSQVLGWYLPGSIPLSSWWGGSAFMEAVYTKRNL